VSESTLASPGPRGGREPITKPTLFRRLAGYYLDLLVSAFLAWIVCFTFRWQADWSSLALLILIAELFWCRDKLNPTIGEFCTGIRYLTSSSAHVVADIKIVNPKFKLNDFILLAGLVEITLAFAFFCGWTFLDQVAFLRLTFGPPLSLIYWTLAGLLFFMCGASFLGGSKNTPWVVILAHGWFSLDLFFSSDEWAARLREAFGPAGPTAWADLTGPHLTEFFCALSLYLIATAFFSRRHWTH